jgi:hypothetical protein
MRCGKNFAEIKRADELQGRADILQYAQSRERNAPRGKSKSQKGQNGQRACEYQ